MDSLQLKLCDIQGRLFELSAEKYDSYSFIKEFMKSDVAKALDSTYNRMQWAGEEYLLEELASKTNIALANHNNVLPNDVLFWIGYVYRYWHFYTGESSKKIISQASAETMSVNYKMFHTMDPSMAVENLKEIYNQKKI